MSSMRPQATQSTIADAETSSTRITRRPRPRPVVSCVRCRRRKIKCDRLIPCQQCKSTGHDRQCSYSTRPKPTEDNSHQALERMISRPGLVDTPFTDLGNTHSQAPITVDTQPDQHPKLETLDSLQQRLQKLEQLCAMAPEKVSNNDKDLRRSDERMNLMDAAISIKTSGPRYHSQSYKKSLLHHMSPIL